jgi:TPR repeat protein
LTFRKGAIPLVIGAVFLYGCTTPPAQHEPAYYPKAQDQGDVPDSSAPSTESASVLTESVEVMPSDSVWQPVSGTDAQPQTAEAVQLYALAQSAETDDLRLAYLEKAAEAGSATAHYDIAKIYTEGKVRPRNLPLAQDHLQASASLGDPEATRVLGWQMVRGDNGPQNLNGGAALMEVGAQTSVRAQRELGMLYADLYDGYRFGEIAKGEMYLVQAYKSGDVPAAVALGRLYIRQGRQIEAVDPLTFANEHGEKSANTMLRELGLEVGSVSTSSVAAANNDEGSGEKFYLQANAIMLSKHDAEDEGRSYALYSMAADRGYNLAKVEMAAIEGVKIQLDASRGAGWLEQEKQAILANSH